MKIEPFLTKVARNNMLHAYYSVDSLKNGEDYCIIDGDINSSLDLGYVPLTLPTVHAIIR